MLTFDQVWSLYHEYYNPKRIFPNQAMPEKRMQKVDSLLAIQDQYDILLLDGFGVLNVGGSAIQHMPNTLKQLKAAGKELFILTNGASYPTDVRAKAYPKLGYDIPAEYIVSSRDGVERLLPTLPLTKQGGTWGVIVGEDAFIERLPAKCELLTQDNIDIVDGFIFLAAGVWNQEWQTRLTAALQKRTRPIIIGNPDISAPLENSFSVEPGFYAIELLKAIPDLEIYYCGKPFTNTYDAAFERIRSVVGDFDPTRVLMVGDTLHTDILGGNMAGCNTLLKADWGFLRGKDPMPFIEESGIVPDFMIQNRS